MLKNVLILSTKRLVQTKLNVTGNDNGVCNSEHIVIGILVFLVLLLGALVSIIGYILMQESNNTLPLLSDMSMNTVSVYCDDLSLSPDEDFDTFEAKKGGMKVSLDKRQNYVCSERNLTFFVQKIVERQLRLRQSKGLDSERYLSCGNQSLQRASGDLTVYFSGISHHQTYKEPGLDVKIHWDKHEKHSFTDKLIHFNKGEIRIPEGQTYFVYASVHFNITEGGEGAYTYKRRFFALRLCRKVQNYEQTLLYNSKKISKSATDVISSLHVTGLLHLNRNDSIYVKVSNANQLILNSRGNTFGVYPI